MFAAGAGALWGLVFLAPELVSAFTPLQLAIGRYLVFGIVSAALIRPRWRGLIAKVHRREWLALAGLGLTGNTLYYVLLSTAVQQGGVAMTSLIMGLLPVTVAIIGSRERDAVSLLRLGPSLLLCIAGALCIGWQALAGPTDRLHAQLIGLLCAVGALVSWTAYAVSNSRCLARLPDISVHDWNLLVGLVTGAQAVALVPVSLAAERLPEAAAAWLDFVAVSIGATLLASLLGNALWNRMSRLLPMTMIGQMVVFETLFALLYGLMWERRLPTAAEIAAFTFVMSGVMACISAHRRQA
jgi:drug/metabolite transporter (DMT)-like permease